MPDLSERLVEYTHSSGSEEWLCEIYKHEELQLPESIRILELEYIEDDGAPPRGRLVEESLLDRPEYTALSYAWDAQKPSMWIDIGETVLPITPNCCNALQMFGKYPEGRRMWVDSICINQKSIDEKNHQVAMMWRIYRSAARVWIWAGLDDFFNGNAMRILNEAADQANLHGNEALEMAYIESKLQSKDPVAFQQNLSPLFEKSWFHRMWVIQEVWPDYQTPKFGDATHTRSNREVSLFCGDERIDWSILMRNAVALYHLDVALGTYSRAMGLFIASQALHSHSDPELNRSLVNILVGAREKKCSDPRDKIFALHGVLGLYGMTMPLPDYHKTVQRVFSEATIAVLEFSNNLNIVLQQASREREIDGLPSWVPDWSVSSFESKRLLEGIIGVSRFSTPFASSRRFETTSGGKELSLFGNFEKIHDISPIRFFSKDNVGKFATLLKSKDPDSLEVVVTTEPDLPSVASGAYWIRYFDTQTRIIFKDWLKVASFHGLETKVQEDAFLSCLERGAHISPKPANVYSRFNEWHDRLLRLADLEAEFENEIHALYTKDRFPGRFNAHRLLRNWGQTLLDFLDVKTNHQIEVEALRSVYTESKNEYTECARDFNFDYEETADRKFIVTENGRFGTVCGNVEKGDIVGHVMGMNEPIVLRAAGEKYTLIGTEAYVHGIMNGEIWPKDDSLLKRVDII